MHRHSRLQNSVYDKEINYQATLTNHADLGKQQTPKINNIRTENKHLDELSPKNSKITISISKYYLFQTNAFLMISFLNFSNKTSIHNRLQTN